MNADRTERLRFDMKDVQVISGSLNRRGGLGAKAVVKIKGVLYVVHGASCGIPNCKCDAYLTLGSTNVS